MVLLIVGRQMSTKLCMSQLVCSLHSRLRGWRHFFRHLAKKIPLPLSLSFNLDEYLFNARQIVVAITPSRL